MRRLFPLLVLFALPALPACNRELTCEVEIAHGAVTFRGSVHGTQSEASLRREALLVACGKLCGGKPADCVGRCAEDAASGKITAHTTCKESSPR
jgi:hypothetical protein